MNIKAAALSCISRRGSLGYRLLFYEGSLSIVGVTPKKQNGEKNKQAMVKTVACIYVIKRKTYEGYGFGTY